MEYFRFIFSAFITLLINNFKSLRKSEIKNILLIRLDHIGDVILTFDALGKLRKEYYKANITIVIGEWNKDLFINSPLVDSIIIYNSPIFSRNINQITSLRDKVGIFRKIRNTKVDLLIGFRDDLFTCLLALLVYPHSRIDRGTIRLKIKIMQIYSGLFNKKNEISQHEIDTNNKIIDPYINRNNVCLDYFPIVDQEKLWLREFYNRHSIGYNNYAIIHAGASWRYKRWKAENFIEVGKYLFSEHNIRSILIGSKDEIEIGEKIYSGNNEKFINIIGGCTLRQSILLIKNAQIAICNDSGPMHIAALLNIPTIGIMGSSDISKFGPRGKKVLLFHKKLECYPCGQVICKYPLLPCVDLNKPEEIIKGIVNIIGSAM